MSSFAGGDKTQLSYDELNLLEDKILPTARRWATERDRDGKLKYPGLKDHGESTLAFWGEKP